MGTCALRMRAQTYAQNVTQRRRYTDEFRKSIASESTSSRAINPWYYSGSIFLSVIAHGFINMLSPSGFKYKAPEKQIMRFWLKEINLWLTIFRSFQFSLWASRAVLINRWQSFTLLSKLVCTVYNRLYVRFFNHDEGVSSSEGHLIIVPCDVIVET